MPLTVSSADTTEREALSLSVLVPVYNEPHLVGASLQRLRVLNSSETLERIEVIVVDDGSSDRTPQVLAQFQREQGDRTAAGEDSKISWHFLRHEKNAGKGKAVQTALARATGQITIIHDADLEYFPDDIIRIAEVFAKHPADAVFGSRFAGGEVRRALLYRHQLGNRLITFLCNMVTNLNLTDIETCYKAIRTDLFKSIPIVSNDFRIEPELTIKLAKRNAVIFEVPISYSGRTYAEGKKIGWRDALGALIAITRFAVSDNLFQTDRYGSQILARLSRAPRFNRWMADTIKPHCGAKILEIGSGIGNLSKQLLPRDYYVASDINPLYLQTLRSLRENHPYFDVSFCDVSDLPSFPSIDEGYDTVICLNVIEHVEDDVRALLNIKSVLRPGGHAIVLVPNDPRLYGTLDEALGHHRRYTETTVAALAEKCGMKTLSIERFNRPGSAAWYLNGKLLRRSHFGRFQVLALNWLTPIFRKIDGMMPLPPLSLIAVLERPLQASGAATNAPAPEQISRTGT